MSRWPSSTSVAVTQSTSQPISRPIRVCMLSTSLESSSTTSARIRATLILHATAAT